MSARKIARWEAEGLLDPGTAARLRDWEQTHSRPLALWATIGIGVLAIGLGIVSVVAANWDAVPGTVRLACHFTILLLLAAALWWRGDAWRAAHPWLQEGALFVLGALGLTFFGHVGQVYQSTSPLWQPLALWLALFAPLTLLRGRSWLTAAMLFAALATACVDRVAWAPEPSRISATTRAILGMILAAPVWAAPLGLVGGRHGGRDEFWRRVAGMGIAYALGGASLATILAGAGELVRASGVGTIVVAAATTLFAAASTAIIQREGIGRATALVTGAAGVATAVSLIANGAQLFAALVFMAMWIAVAAASLLSGWRRVFQAAVGILAMRLIILSFELAGDLLGSGFGLILAGALILGIAVAAVRVGRMFAPAAGDGA